MTFSTRTAIVSLMLLSLVAGAAVLSGWLPAQAAGAVALFFFLPGALMSLAFIPLRASDLPLRVVSMLGLSISASILIAVAVLAAGAGFSRAAMVACWLVVTSASGLVALIRAHPSRRDRGYRRMLPGRALVPAVAGALVLAFLGARFASSYHQNAYLELGVAEAGHGVAVTIGNGTNGTRTLLYNVHGGTRTVARGSVSLRPGQRTQIRVPYIRPGTEVSARVHTRDDAISRSVRLLAGPSAGGPPYGPQSIFPPR